jgi:hypothetical protein
LLIAFCRPFAVEFALTGLIVYITQLYFATRIYYFLHIAGSKKWSQGKLLSGSVFLIATLSLIFGIVSAIFQFEHPTGADLSTTRMKITIGLWHGVAGVADLVTTAALVFHLKHQSTDIRRTNSTVARLINYTMTRGIFITALQVSLVILFSVDTDKLYWMAPHLCCNKFYIITMIAMLNSRTKLFQKHHRSGIINSSQFAPAPYCADPADAMQSQGGHHSDSGVNLEQYQLHDVSDKEISDNAPLEIKVDIQVTSDNADLNPKSGSVMQPSKD